MKIKKIVDTVLQGYIDTYFTPLDAAIVVLSEENGLVYVDIPEQCMGTEDLRKVAKLFLRLAEAIETAP